MSTQRPDTLWLEKAGGVWPAWAVDSAAIAFSTPAPGTTRQVPTLAFSQKLPIHAHGELMQNLIQSKGNH